VGSGNAECGKTGGEKVGRWDGEKVGRGEGEKIGGTVISNSILLDVGAVFARIPLQFSGATAI
jgi:hypothetical protein